MDTEIGVHYDVNCLSDLDIKIEELQYFLFNPQTYLQTLSKDNLVLVYLILI